MPDPNDPWTKPLPKKIEYLDPNDPPPLPLAMSNQDYERVRDWLSMKENPTYETHHGERIGIEILDILRSIEDKLTDLLKLARADKETP